MSVPKLRFKEFDDEWENACLVDLSIDKSLNNGVFNDQNKVGKGYKLINVLDMYIERDIDENRLSLLDLEKKEFERNQVKFGDIFFTRSSLVKEGIAFSNVYLGNSNDITYDGHLIKLSPDLNTINPIFLNYVLKTGQVRKQLIQGGKTATMTTIGQKEVGSSKVDFPSKSEQTKIASFLSAVDEKISQLNQKHELLSQYKQGMMQKLFSQQIRFKADDGSEFGEWEEKILKDLFPKIRNGFVGVATPYYVDYGVKYLQGKNIKNGKIDDKGLIYINQEFHQKKTNSILKTNDILMVQSGHVGECSVVTEDYDNANCHALLVLSPKSSKLIKSKFVVYYFYSEIGKKKITLIKTGNTIEHILASDIKEVSLLFPCIEEQTKIANFLSSIDQKIEVVAQQIEQAKQWKKGLLQQMFV